MTRTGNKARATTPSTKSPPNPYPGVPHYPPRTQIRAPHSDTQQTTTCTSGQAKEEKYRHTKATQGTEPNTPHLGWHTFAPSHTLNDTHLHTQQGTHPTRLLPTRNNPPQPQEDTPQGDLQPGRQNQTDQTQRRTTTSNQPRPTSTQTPTSRESPPTPTHTTRDATQQDPEDRGNPQQATRHSNPKAAHQHETTQPPHHLPQPTPPHNPNTAHQDHPTQPGNTQHTQPTSRLEAAPPPQETTPWPVTPSQPPDTHHNQNPKAMTNRPPPPCSPCQRQQPA